MPTADNHDTGFAAVFDCPAGRRILARLNPQTRPTPRQDQQRPPNNQPAPTPRTEQ